MTWKVIGDKFESAQLVQKLKFEENKDIVAFRAWFIIYNTPVYTGVL
jgi:hypothetical protein